MTTYDVYLISRLLHRIEVYQYTPLEVSASFLITPKIKEKKRGRGGELNQHLSKVTIIKKILENHRWWDVNVMILHGTYIVMMMRRCACHGHDVL